MTERNAAPGRAAAGDLLARRVVRAPHKEKNHTPRHSEAVRPKNPYSRPWLPQGAPRKAERLSWGEDEQGSGVKNVRQGILNGADFARTKGAVTEGD